MGCLREDVSGVSSCTDRCNAHASLYRSVHCIRITLPTAGQTTSCTASLGPKTCDSMHCAGVAHTLMRWMSMRLCLGWVALAQRASCLNAPARLSQGCSADAKTLVRSARASSLLSDRVYQKLVILTSTQASPPLWHSLPSRLCPAACSLM